MSTSTVPCRRSDGVATGSPHVWIAYHVICMTPARTTGLDVVVVRYVPARRDGRHRAVGSTFSVPVVDLDVVWIWGTFPGFHKRLQTHQEKRPLGAAVVHEF